MLNAFGSAAFAFRLSSRPEARRGVVEEARSGGTPSRDTRYRGSTLPHPRLADPAEDS